MLLLAFLLSAAFAGPPSSESSLRLVYTGGSGGVGAGMYAFELLAELRELEDSGALTLGELEPVHGTLAQGTWLVHAVDRRVATAVTALDAGGFTCALPTEVWGLESHLGDLVLEASGRPDWLDQLPEHLGSPQLYLRRLCVGIEGRELVVLGRQDSARPPEESLEAFEFRTAVAGQVSQAGVTTPFTLVGKPVQELSRTVARSKQLMAETPGALFVDAGDFLDGATALGPDGLSLHRPTGLAVLKGLEPAALAPGANELLPGPGAFLLEARSYGLPYVATNWESEQPELQLPRSRVVTVQQGEETLRVAFLGVLDPSLQERLPGLAAEGVTLSDPVRAAQREVDALVASGSPPNVVVLLTTADAEVQRRLRVRVRGADVMLGDRSFATLKVQQDHVQLRTLGRQVKGASLTLPMDGLSVLDLTLHQGQLTELRFSPELIYGEQPHEADLTAVITRTRAELYPGLDHLLLPARADTPNAALTEQEWSQVVCEAVRWRTGADTVLLADLPYSRRLPGPQTELQVLDQLATTEVLELHRVPGSKLQGLLDKSYGAVPIACGASPGTGAAKAWGRSIDPARMYRVVTTRATRAATGLDSLLASATAARPLDPPPMSVLQDSEDQPLRLSAAVVSALQSWQDAPPVDGSVTDWLLTQAASATPPAVSLNLRGLSLKAERFRGVPGEVFSSVPETLATSPDSLTLGGSADLALERSGKSLSWDTRLRGTYSSLSVEGAEAQETADDWRASASLTAPTLAFPPKAPLRAMPYTELLYDSEFTATTQEDGSENPRQGDLSLTLGLSTTAWRDLKRLRAGAFVNDDLAQPGKPLEWGGRMEFETLTQLGSVLKLGSKGDAQLFAGPLTSDPSDLRARLFGELRLSAPAVRAVDLSLYAQGFALYGRSTETAQWGASYNLGAALDVRGVFGGRPRLD